MLHLREPYSRRYTVHVCASSRPARGPTTIQRHTPSTGRTCAGWRRVSNGIDLGERFPPTHSKAIRSTQMTTRTSMAWRLLPLLVVAEVFACLSRGAPWLGEWAWTIDSINGAIIVMGPLLGGLSALDASQVFRRGETPWVASLPRGWLMPFTLIASNWLVGVGIHISALIAGSAANLYVGAEGPVSLQSVPTALLVLAACAAIGVLSGALLPNPVTAPLCAAVLFGVTVVGADASSPLRVFRPGGSTGTLVGLTWDAAFLTQAVGALECDNPALLRASIRAY